jgi:hypothetical protein
MMPRRRTCLILQVKSSTLFDQNSPDQNEGPVLTNILKTHANFRNLKIQFKVEKNLHRLSHSSVTDLYFGQCSTQVEL